MKKAFTMLEMIVVVIIIAILAAVALPALTKSKENALGREANLTLKLLQDAEQFYQIEYNTYLNFANASDANTKLKLYIPASSSANWDYKVPDATNTTFTAKAQRVGVGSDGRTYCINQSSNDTYSTGCTW